MDTKQAINLIYHNNPPRQNEVARELGVSRQRFNNWMRGLWEPDTRSLRKMLHGDDIQRKFAAAVLGIYGGFSVEQNAQMPQDGLGTSVLPIHDETGVVVAQRSGQEQPGGNADNLEAGLDG